MPAKAGLHVLRIIRCAVWKWSRAFRRDDGRFQLADKPKERGRPLLADPNSLP
jgi:hypothetical protein